MIEIGPTLAGTITVVTGLVVLGFVIYRLIR